MKIMSSKAFLFLALVAALVLLISSEVAARDFAETSYEKNNGEVATAVEDAKYGGPSWNGGPGWNNGRPGGRHGGGRGGYGGGNRERGGHGGRCAFGCCRSDHYGRGCLQCC